MNPRPERVLPFGQTEPSLEMAALAGKLPSLGRPDGYSFAPSQNKIEFDLTDWNATNAELGLPLMRDESGDPLRNGVQIADAGWARTYVDDRLNAAAQRDRVRIGGQNSAGDVDEGVPTPLALRSAPEFKDLGRSVLNGLVELANLGLQVGRGALRLYDRNPDGSPNVASLTAPILDGWRLNYESESYRDGLGLFGELATGMLAPTGLARIRSFGLGSPSARALGNLTDNQLTALRAAGLGDAEIAPQISTLADDVGRGASSELIAARQQLAAMAKIEPNVTQTLSEVAAANGGEMLGLEYRLKSVESLARKIAGQPGVPINDALRYTMSFDEASLADGVKATMARLEQQGYKPTVLRNTFKDGQPYKGINTTYLTPEGEMLELQFHTPESFRMKDVINHPLYEQQRVLPHTEPAWETLRNQMIENSSGVPNPPGVSSIKKPKGRT